jgi:restriction system protein
MSQQHFALDASFGPEPRRPLLLLALLIAGSVLWLLVYAALGWRLWQEGALRIDAVSLLLLFLTVGLGVAMALTWHTAWPQLRRRDETNGWPALTLAQMHKLTPSQFEEYVAQRLFARQGYEVINTPDVKDGGVDVLLINADGQQEIVQCKLYRDTVGEPVVRDLYGTMEHHDAVHAYVVTTAPISAEAEEWAADKPITLIDGKELEQLVK